MGPMNRSRRLSNVFFTFLGAAAVGLVIAVLAVTGALDDLAGTEQPAATAMPTTPSARIDRAPVADHQSNTPTDVSDIYARVAPGVAFISASSNGAASTFGEDGGGSATGSGFLIDGQGHVVTNDHVVEGADSFSIRFGEGGKPLDAKLVGTDPSTDLAVLEVDPAKIPAETKPLELATSGDLQPGDAAIAIGSPFGLSGTVTTGIISALDREITSPNGFPIAGVLQTDAAINPGNSGGPLLDAQGRVIGVNSQIASSSRQSSGVGFAVAVDTVKEVVPQLIKGGEIERAYLGVSSIEEPGSPGAVVADVAAGGPASSSQLRTGDRIVKLGDRDVENPSDLSTGILSFKPGDRVKLTVDRNGQETTIDVTLGTRPDQLQR
jgi:S1-C subfamily serine protease